MVVITCAMEEVLFDPSQTVTSQVDGKRFGIVDCIGHVTKRNVLAVDHTDLGSTSRTSAQLIERARLHVVSFSPVERTGCSGRQGGHRYQ